MNKCLEAYRVALTNWNNNEFGHVGKQLAKAQNSLQRAEELSKDSEEIKKLKMEVNKWLEAEATMWHQRSRICWLQGGDRNTRLLHEKASNRKHQNSIWGIMDEGGQWQEDPQVVGETIVKYYH